MSKTLEYLRENGPSTGDDLPFHPTVKDKEQGVARLAVRRNTNGGRSGMGRQLAIYYVMGEHDKQRVVEEYLQTNEDLLEIDKKHAVNLISRNGKDWKKPARKAYEEVAKP